MIPLPWRLTAALVLLAALAGGAWWYGHTRYRAGYAAAEAVWQRSVAEAGERFAAALADQQQVLGRTESALQRSRAQATRRQEGLSDAARSSPAAVEWADTRLPDPIRLSLGAGDPAVPAHP